MDIVYASNDKYMQPLLVSMQSIVNNVKNDCITFHILSDDISLENQDKIKKFEKRNSIKIFIYDMKDTRDKILKRIPPLTGAVSTYYRLFIEDIIDVNVKKVLYIDCDTVVMEDISYLYKIPFKNTDIIGGVMEIADKEMKTRIGLTENDVYINAGMLLIDLKKWKEFNVKEKCLGYIESKNGDVYYKDQGTLNYVLKNRICIFPLKANVTSQLYMLINSKYRVLEYPLNFYKLNEIHDSIRNPLILHFTGMYGCHPWNEKCIHPKCNIYDDILEKIPEISHGKNKLSWLYEIEKFLYYNISVRGFNTYLALIQRIRGVFKS